MGTPIWCLRAQASSNLGSRDLNRWNLCLMLKISHASSPALSLVISTQFAFEMCVAAQNRQKIHKTPFCLLRASTVIAFGANRQPVYDFILVINSNLGPISHRFRDTAIYWLKIANFPYLFSFSGLVRNDPLWIYGKALRFLKLESSRQPMVKIWWS